MKAKPAELQDGLSGIALLAGGANVVMQLARLPVGHGVVHSPVESGNLYRHPVKRTRTTLMFLVMAVEGTPEERTAIRKEIDRVHVHVRSSKSSPVQYNAFDPELQLWVAACIYRGAEDTYRVLWGEPDPETRESLYQEGKRFGSTLQVREDMWPADRIAFDEYWDREVKQIEMDDDTRGLLRGITRVTFLPQPFQWLLGPFMQFLTLGFLYPEFREQLGLPWSERQQRRFERLMRVFAVVNRAMPRLIREFPLNLVRWDTRRRLRAGKPVL
jgi:uncharacterized protein (DUF2236 family)